MKSIEKQAKHITEYAFWNTKYQCNQFGVTEICDFCGKTYGLGYVYWKENKIVCIYCEVIKLFK